VTSLSNPSPPAPDANAARPGRVPLLAFTSDAETERALRDGLSDIVPKKIEFRHAGIRAAIATLASMATPATLIVDLSGEENPLVALSELSQVLEPNVRLLVVGDREGVDFYRQVIRDLGALEYLHKPLTRDIVARHFGPLLSETAVLQGAVQTGRLVTVTGARGGVGASTIAANLSWYLAACRSGVLGHWVGDDVGGGSWASGWRCAAEFVVAAILAASIGIWPPARRSIDGRSGAIWLRSRPPGRTSASCSTPWSRGSTRHGHCRGRATGTDGSQART